MRLISGFYCKIPWKFFEDSPVCRQPDSKALVPSLYLVSFPLLSNPWSELDLETGSKNIEVIRS